MWYKIDRFSSVGIIDGHFVVDDKDNQNTSAIDYINSLWKGDTDLFMSMVRFFGFRRLKKAYRKLQWLSPLRQVKLNFAAAENVLTDWLETCYKVGINPLPALRDKGIKVIWGCSCPQDADLAVYWSDNQDLILSTPSLNPVALTGKYLEMQNEKRERPTHRIVHKTCSEVE